MVTVDENGRLTSCQLDAILGIGKDSQAMSPDSGPDRPIAMLCDVRRRAGHAGAGALRDLAAEPPRSQAVPEEPGGLDIELHAWWRLPESGR